MLNLGHLINAPKDLRAGHHPCFAYQQWKEILWMENGPPYARGMRSTDAQSKKPLFETIVTRAVIYSDMLQTPIRVEGVVCILRYTNRLSKEWERNICKKIALIQRMTIEYQNTVTNHYCKKCNM